MKTVSFRTVAKKTWLLVAARRKTFLLYAVGMLALYLLGDWLTYSNSSPEGEPKFTTLDVLLGLLTFFASSALFISIQHFSILSVRNETSYFRPRPVRVFFQYILTSMAWAAICFIGMIIAALPFAAVYFSDVANNPETAIVGIALLVITALLMFLGGMIPAVRLGAVFPAIAAGDKYNFTRAWAMTKGHTLKILGTNVLFSLPLFTIGAVVPLVIPDFAVGKGHYSVWGSLINSTAMALMMVYWYAFLCLLYEDLAIRLDSMGNVRETIAGEDG